MKSLILLTVVLAISVCSLNATLSCSCGFKPLPIWDQPPFTLNNASQNYCNGVCCDGPSCSMSNCEQACECVPCPPSDCWQLDRNSPWAAYPSFVVSYDQWCKEVCAGTYYKDAENCNDICVRC